MRRGAGTKSKISFVLAGDSFDTGVRELIDEKGIKVNICHSNLLLDRIDLNHKKICRIFRFCSISFFFMKNNLIYNNFNVFYFQQTCSRGSINNFVLSTSEWLGPLTFIRIWHDNSGEGKFQGWYLSKVIVTDLQTSETYVLLK